MFPTLPLRARRFAVAIALIAAGALLAQWLYLIDYLDLGPVATLFQMTRFFTILTTALVAVTYLAIALRPIRSVGAPWLAALTLSVAMVGLVYHAALSHLWNPTGLGLWADHGLHTVLPLACLAWWLVFAPKSALIWADLPMFILWPSVYTAYALGLGAQDGIYPYPFMDVGAFGPAAVAATLGLLMILTLLGGVLMIAVGRYADR